jgi:transcriptional regulator with XRE-family HTH domain
MLLTKSETRHRCRASCGAHTWLHAGTRGHRRALVLSAIAARFLGADTRNGHPRAASPNKEPGSPSCKKARPAACTPDLRFPAGMLRATIQRKMPLPHTILPMTQDMDLEDVVRSRIRGLRVARGWSLDDLARHCHLSPSNLSRIETGHRRIALDQLLPIARALGTTLDQLLESVDDDDIVIRPQRDVVRGMTTWLLTPRERGPHG